MSVETDLSH